MDSIADLRPPTPSGRTRRRLPRVGLFARRYLRRGWSPIPLPPRRKQSVMEGWPDLRLTLADVASAFPPDANLGILLGDPSGGLVDVDLDSTEAILLAALLLPPTACRFGRRGKPSSHWGYRADPVPRTRQFRDLTGTMLVELRSTGSQTVFPPSQHPSGERIRWEADDPPATVDGDVLAGAVARLAAAALLCRAWPAVGSRQEAALALAGGLLRLGWETPAVDRFIAAVAQIAGDEETAKRATAAGYTARRLEAGRPATGWPHLAALIGEDIVACAQRWIGPPRAPQPEPADQGDFSQFQASQGSYVFRRAGPRGTTTEEPLSNWVATPVERLRCEDGCELLRLRAQLVGDDDIHLLTLPAKALAGRRELIGALPSTEYVWMGTDKHVQMLRAHLRRSPTRRRQATGAMGRHGGLIVLPSGTYGPDRPLASAPLTYVDPGGDADMPFARMVRAAWAEPEVVARAMRAVARDLPRVNVAAVMVPILGWLGALPWATLFRQGAEAWGGFPHLGIFGSQGGGKTSLGRLLWRLCGIPLSCEPMSLSSSPFSRQRTLAASNLPPVWIDEFRPSGWLPAAVQQLHHELCAAYGGETLQRGLATLGVRAYRLRAPILLSGEDCPADPALRERLLAVTPNPESLRDPRADFTTTFHRLHRAPLEAFALAYWTWALRQDDWLAQADAARRWVQDVFEGAGCQLPVRAVNNVAIAVFGLRMLQRFLGRPALRWAGGTVEDAVLRQAARLFPAGERRLPLDDLLRLAASQLHTTLRYGHHWVLSGGRVVVRLDAVVDDLRGFVRQSGHPTEILSVEAYRRQATEQQGRRGSYVVDTSVSARFGARVLRGAALCPARLARALQIDPDLWRGPTGRAAGRGGREVPNPRVPDGMARRRARRPRR
jgi:Bifunctional DNA primase/polymerase, N-terminal